MADEHHVPRSLIWSRAWPPPVVGAHAHPGPRSPPGSRGSQQPARCLGGSRGWSGPVVAVIPPRPAGAAPRRPSARRVRRWPARRRGPLTTIGLSRPRSARVIAANRACSRPTSVRSEIGGRCVCDHATIWFRHDGRTSRWLPTPHVERFCTNLTGWCGRDPEYWQWPTKGGNWPRRPRWLRWEQHSPARARCCSWNPAAGAASPSRHPTSCWGVRMRCCSVKSRPAALPGEYPLGNGRCRPISTWPVRRPCC